MAAMEVLEKEENGSIAARDEALENFLKSSGWLDSAPPEPLNEDCGTRHYLRLRKGKATAVLLDTLTDDDPRLSKGHKLSDFVRLAALMREKGIRVPEIYAHDIKNGYALIEDFGDLMLSEAASDMTSKKNLYENAIEALVPVNKMEGTGLRIFFDDHIYTDTDAFIHWYCQCVDTGLDSQNLIIQFQKLREDIVQSLPDPVYGFVHGDYHAENLMVLKQNAIGILDFQGAFHGPVAYDLANILYDARRDIGDVLREALIERYCAHFTKEEQESIKMWLPVLACIFHCRVIGLFIKLAQIDGKTRYVKHLPRLTAWVEQMSSANPSLHPLKSFLENNRISLRLIDGLFPSD